MQEQRRVPYRSRRPAVPQFIVAVVLGVLLTSVFARPALAGFEIKVNVLAGPLPGFVTSGDLNGDGKPDLITSVSALNQVAVSLSNGDGTFQLPISAPTTAGINPVIAVADFDGNHKLDLALSSPSDGTVRILLGNGDGTFQAEQTLAVGNSPVFIVAADVDHNGTADLVVANVNQDNVGVILGNGNGTFQAEQTFGAGDGPNSVVVADLNGDGNPDVALTNNNVTTVSVLLGNGNGTFQAQKTFTVGELPNSIAAADFNGDGKPDLVVANQNEQFASVLLGNGDGTFQAQTKPAANFTSSVVVGDFNIDGRPDIALYDGAGAEVLLGNGDGTFQPFLLVVTANASQNIAVADFNTDSRPDLFSADAGSANVAVRFGTDPSPIQFAVGPTTSTTESGTVTYTFTRSGNLDGPIAARLNVTGGTATNGQDFTLLTPVAITWADKEGGSKTVPVPIVADQVDEDDETAQLTLSFAPGGSWGALGSRSNVTLTIVDDDPQPFVSIANANAPEGNAGPTTMSVTASLSVPSSKPVTVQYATADDSATAGSDYTATAGTLTFAPSETTKTISVPSLVTRRRSKTNPSPSPCPARRTRCWVRLRRLGSSATMTRPRRARS